MRTREEMEAKGLTPEETKHSGHRRARWHDYALPGVYMLTLITDGRQRVFGEVVGRSHAARGTADYPHLQPSTFGQKVLEEEVKKISKYYPMVEVWKVVLMPDHIHLLVCVREPLPEGKHLGLVVSGFKAGCSQAWWRWQDEQRAGLGNGGGGNALGRTLGNGNGEGRTLGNGNGKGRTLANGHGEGRTHGYRDAGNLPNVVTAPESAPHPVPVPEGSPEGEKERRPVLFEPGYHDRIVRDAEMLGNIRRYMDENPFRAKLRSEIPHLMQRRLHLWIHDREYAAFGNLFLLKNPERIQVFFHRKNKAGIPTHLTPNTPRIGISYSDAPKKERCS